MVMQLHIPQKALLVLCSMVLLAFIPRPGAAQTLTNTDVAMRPPQLREAQVKPKVILSVDTSGSMRTRAYQGKNFTINEPYVGSFDSDACYLYDDTPGKEYFYALNGVTRGPGCMGWAGHFLNWVSMRRTDILREILIGARAEAVVGTTHYSRREAVLQGITADYYVKAMDTSNANGGANLLGGADLAAVSPYTGNAYIHLCNDKLVVSKNGRIGNNNQIQNECRNPNANSNNQYDVFRIRILSKAEPTGLIQDSSLQFDFGVAVFSSGQQGADAGTLRPCYRPANEPNVSERCIDTYAGAPLEDLIEVIENFPTGGGTPIAETLFEIGGYIKQTPHRGNYGAAYFDTRNKNGAYGLYGPNQKHWDPFYNKDLDDLVPCTPVFVININDGTPSGDWDQGAPNVPRVWGQPRDGEAIDSVAWSLRGDCRNDLPGNQDVRSFYVFADLSGSTRGNDLRKLREAAAVGGVDITELANGNFEPVDKPFFPGDNNRDPLTGQQSGLERNPQPQAATSWDKDGDGDPDNLLLATSPDALKQALFRVLGLVNQQVGAGGAAAVSSSSHRGDGILIQALMYPKQKDIQTNSEVSWTGSVHALFVDSDGNFREDGNQNGILDDTATDPIIVYTNDPQNGTAITRMQPDGTRGATVPLKNLRAVWRAEDQFFDFTNALAENQRSYNTLGRERYVFTGAKSVVTRGAGAANSQDFIAANFDEDDASWFGINCQTQGLSDAQCKDKIQQIVNYIRGSEFNNTRNRTLLDSTGSERRLLIGDIVNSSPLLVGPPNSDFGSYDATYNNFTNSYAQRRHVLYVGANDGMLHAFNSGFWDGTAKQAKTSINGETAFTLGQELWGYVPVNTWPHLQWLASADYQHTFYVDGSPKAFDAKIFTPSNKHPDGWGTILVVGMGFGGHPTTIQDGNAVHQSGSAYIILDITDPESAPVLIDEFFIPGLGYTVSTPNITHSAGEWNLVFGSGPTNKITGTSDKPATVYRYDLKRRTLDSQATITTSASGFIGDIGVADWDDDGNSDATYFGLVEGREGGALIQWPVLSNIPSILYNTGKAVTAEPTAFLATPSNWLYFGSGKLIVSEDNSLNSQQSFYGLKIDNSGKYSGNRLINTTNISMKKNNQNTIECTSGCPAGVTTYNELVNYMANDAIGGWQYDLEPSLNTVSPSGRNLGKALMLFQRVFFTDYIPPTSLCGERGKTYLNALDFKTGTPGDSQIFEGFDPDDEHEGRVFLGDGLLSDLAEIGGTDENANITSQSDAGELIKIEVVPPPEPTATAAGRVSWRQLPFSP